MNILKKITLLFLMAISSISHAVSPDAGLWSIVPEITGKPGRGFQIDMQGDTLILTFYGYETDGRSTFYLASGKYANDQFSGDLLISEGGTTLGGEIKPATIRGSAGNITLSFSSETEGIIILPGESPKAIQRFAAYDMSQALAAFNSFSGVRYTITSNPHHKGMAGRDSNTDNSMYLVDGIFKYNYDTGLFGRICRLSGTYRNSGPTVSSEGSYECSDFEEGSYYATNLKIDKDGVFSGFFHLKTKDSGIENMEIHSGIRLHPILTPSIPITPVSPQNGLWSIVSEITGKPGRGIQIDIQGKTLILTVYGYDQQGNPVFYLASGQYQDGYFSSDLLISEGGTSLGGEFKPAKISGSAGKVSLFFSDSTTGIIKLPGESEKEITRFTAFNMSERFLNRSKPEYNSGLSGSTYNEHWALMKSSTTFGFNVDRDGNFELTVEQFGTQDCIYSGKYAIAGPSLRAEGNYKCKNFTKGTYKAIDLTIDEYGVYTGKFYKKPENSTKELLEIHSAI